MCLFIAVKNMLNCSVVYYSITVVLFLLFELDQPVSYTDTHVWNQQVSLSCDKQQQQQQRRGMVSQKLLKRQHATFWFMNVGQSVYSCSECLTPATGFRSATFRCFVLSNLQPVTTCCGLKRPRLASLLSWEKWKVVYVVDNDLSRLGLGYCNPVCMGLLAAGVRRSITMLSPPLQIYVNNSVAHKNVNFMSIAFSVVQTLYIK